MDSLVLPAIHFRYLRRAGEEWQIKGAVWMSSGQRPAPTATGRAAAMVCRIELWWTLTPDDPPWREYVVTRRAADILRAQSDLDDFCFRHALSLALCRYAVQRTMLDLVGHSLERAEHVIGRDQVSVLQGIGLPMCEFREVVDGDFRCSLDGGDDPRTTSGLCQSCGLPEPFERCAHLCHLETVLVEGSDCGTVRRTCNALCDLGSTPDGGIPQVCRAGDQSPDCFEPMLVDSDAEAARVLCESAAGPDPTTIQVHDEYVYDVALSFAGEDRACVDPIARELERRGVKVFYDELESADLWGRDLYRHLASIYRDKARYCVLFASAAYARKPWPSHELRAAQARDLREQGEYILPVRLDNTELPGLHDTIGYLHYDANVIIRCVLAKLGRQAGTESDQAVPSARHRTLGERSEVELDQISRLVHDVLGFDDSEDDITIMPPLGGPLGDQVPSDGLQSLVLPEGEAAVLPDLVGAIRKAYPKRRVGIRFAVPQDLAHDRSWQTNDMVLLGGQNVNAAVRQIVTDFDRRSWPDFPRIWLRPIRRPDHVSGPNAPKTHQLQFRILSDNRCHDAAAILLRARNPYSPDHKIVMIAGNETYGTAGGILALLESDTLALIAGSAASDSGPLNFAVMVQARLFDAWPVKIEPRLR